MDRISLLADELKLILDRLHEEAAVDQARSLMAPLAWLDEANAWLRYELAHLPDPEYRDPVQFTHIPLSLPK